MSALCGGVRNAFACSVKEGVFRLYQGPRDKEDFMKFIEEKKWTVVEPISSWKNPESMQ